LTLVTTVWRPLHRNATVEEDQDDRNYIDRFRRTFVWRTEETFSTFIRRFLHSALSTFHYRLQAEACWTGSKLVMRTTIIQHLKAATDISVIDTIPHIYHPEFARVTAVQQPAYLISRRDFSEERQPETGRRLPIMCHAMITQSLNANQSVVMLDDLRFEGPKLHAWALLERPGDELTRRLHAECQVGDAIPCMVVLLDVVTPPPCKSTALSAGHAPRATSRVSPCA
jgi:hypothetical protein